MKALSEAVSEGSVAGEGLLDSLRRLYSTEREISVATEMRRLLNKLGAKRIARKDVTAAFDRSLTDEEKSSLEDAVSKIRTFYDGLREEKGGFSLRYEVESLIATGGMAKIFLGRRLEDNAPVAIKFLKDEYADQQDFVERFERESEIIMGIDHPNIVTVYERLYRGNQLCIIMEYVAGGHLGSWIRRPEASTAFMLEMVRQVCAGLSHVHAQGIVHRDIKPSNVLLAGAPPAPGKTTAILSDFGLAKSVTSSPLTTEHEIMGTERYISPEQRLSTRNVDHRSDLYSLGMMMYEMLSKGDLPVGDYQSLNSLDPEIPPAMDEIVERCIRQRPEERWESVDKIRENLDF